MRIAHGRGFLIPEFLSAGLEQLAVRCQRHGRLLDIGTRLLQGQGQVAQFLCQHIGCFLIILPITPAEKVDRFGPVKYLSRQQFGYFTPSGIAGGDDDMTAACTGEVVTHLIGILCIIKDEQPA